MSANDTRPVSELFADALNQLSKLLRNELQLARAEITMKISQAMTAIGLLAGAAIVLIPTMVLLLISLAAWLVEIGMRPSVAHLIAGVVGLLGVAILGGIGLNRLKTNPLLPKRTLGQLQQDAAAAREHV
jgi:Putative Actinobacterial Holin-X, holin superfamily III